jgi:hypothetical protein
MISLKLKEDTSELLKILGKMTCVINDEEFLSNALRVSQ